MATVCTVSTQNWALEFVDLGLISKFKAGLLVGLVPVTHSAHLFFCLQNGDAIAPHAKNCHGSSREVSPLTRLPPSTTAVSVFSPQPIPSPQPQSRVQTTQAAQRAASESVLLLLLLFFTLFQFLKVLPSFKISLGVLISSCSSVSRALSSNGKNR